MKHRELRFSPEQLRTSRRTSAYACVGLKERGGALYPAEGAEACATVGASAKQLFAAAGAVYAGGNGFLYDVSAQTAYTILGKLTAAAAYRETSGESILFFLTERGLFRLAGEDYNQVPRMEGGYHLAFYHERLFTAKGCELRYTPPLDPRVWDPDTQDAGVLPIPWQDGPIVALACFDDALYVFAEHAIYCLTARGEDLDFRLEKLDFAAGTIAAGSAWVCGDALLFCCTRGLVRYKGSFRLLRTAEEMGCVAGVPTAASRGEYFAIAERAGKRCLYVYDVFSDTDRVLDLDADCVAGDFGGVVFVKDGKAYALTGVAEEGTLYAKLHVSDGDPARIDCAACEGEGTFALTLQAKDRSVETALPAGKRKQLPRTVYADQAEIWVRVPAGGKLTALTLYLREE